MSSNGYVSPEKSNPDHAQFALKIKREGKGEGTDLRVKLDGNFVRRRPGKTMREFDDACLAPAPVLAPEGIKAIRESEHVSQPVFARYLNVSKNLVSDWERGAKKPGGPALRLLSIIQRNGLDAVA